MMDAFALNSKIAELEEAKESLERQNSQLRHDAADYDRERRGLLDLLDDGKMRLKECEQMLEMEVARSKEMEGGRSAAAERLAMELKWVRRELSEKTLRIKVGFDSSLAQDLFYSAETSEDKHKAGMQITCFRSRRSRSQQPGKNVAIAEYAIGRRQPRTG